jgi:hypothetical protein
MVDTKVLARFAADVGAAYSRLAEALADPEPKPDRVRIVGKRAVDVLRGERQRAVYEFLAKAGDDAKTTREINDGIRYDFSNTYSTVHRLKDLGFLEMLPGVSPQTWRLAAEYRDAS